MTAWVAAGRTAGIPIDADRVRVRAGGSFSVSKNHIADILVEDGVRATRQQVFDDLLGAGGPLHVERFALRLIDAISLVREAGGVPVVAHAWGRRPSRAALTPDQWPALVEAGLVGVEVDHQQHDEATRELLRARAAFARLQTAAQL